jgi:riboflavin kinase/FMN adenylyltransferase
LQQAGAEHLLVMQTTPQLLHLEAREFFERMLIARLQIAGLVEGQDFRFGRQRLGDVQLLEHLCGEYGRHLQIVPPLLHDGLPISSSRVRQALEEGKVELARDLLGRPYAVTGRVRVGARRGQTLGFPTANLTDVETVLPADGVYAVWVRGLRWSEQAAEMVPSAVVVHPTEADTSAAVTTPEEKTVSSVQELGHSVRKSSQLSYWVGEEILASDSPWLGAAHIGPNPTFGEQQRKIEVHLLNFVGNLYGQRLRLEFLARIRGTQRFASTTELIDQLRRDVAMVHQIGRQERGHG